MNDTPVFQAAWPAHRTSGPTADREKLRTKLNRMEWGVGVFGAFLVVFSMILYFITTTCDQISEIISEQNRAAEKISSSLNYYGSSLFRVGTGLFPPATLVRSAS